MVPEGLRIILPFDGMVVEGALTGYRIEGTDSLLLRDDGVGVIDAQKRLVGPSDQLLEHLRGYCLPPVGLTLPPLEEFLAPEFQWPRALFPVIGFSTFHAAVGDKRWMNRALAQVAGWSSLASGRIALETRIVDSHPEVRGPRLPATGDG